MDVNTDKEQMFLGKELAEKVFEEQWNFLRNHYNVEDRTMAEFLDSTRIDLEFKHFKDTKQHKAKYDKYSSVVKNPPRYIIYIDVNKLNRDHYGRMFIGDMLRDRMLDLYHELRDEYYRFKRNNGYGYILPDISFAKYIKNRDKYIKQYNK